MYYIKIMGDIKKWWSVILPQCWRMTENHQSRVVPRFTTWIGGSHPTLEQICQIGWNDSQVVLAFDWRFQYRQYHQCIIPLCIHYNTRVQCIHSFGVHGNKYNTGIFINTLLAYNHIIWLHIQGGVVETWWSHDLFCLMIMINSTKMSSYSVTNWSKAVFCEISSVYYSNKRCITPVIIKYNVSSSAATY